MPLYDVFEEVKVTNYLSEKVTAKVDTDLVGLGNSYEINMFLTSDLESRLSVYFDTVADFKKFVENLQTIVSEIENVDV